jgi:hypothetical protein
VLTVCGTTVGETVINGATGRVIFGSPTVDGCTGNTVRGNLRLQSNRGGVVVGGNVISGWLQCSGNSPVATNGGAPNRSAGRTGECAAPTF